MGQESSARKTFYYPVMKGKRRYAGVRVGAHKARFTVFRLCLYFVCFCIYILYIYILPSPFQRGQRCPFFPRFVFDASFFCMTYNVPCLIFLNMFCIVLYAYCIHILVCTYMLKPT